jgi:hypothetical protein
MLCDKLEINDGKTDFILIGTRQQLLKVLVNSLAVGDVRVSSVTSVKNLGTWMDSNLNLQVNINNTCKAAYYHLTNIRRIRKYLDENAARKLINALIVGHIDYCNGILYGLPATQIIKLQRLQNAAARLVLNIPKYNHISPALCTLHWLPVKFRIQFKIAVITFKTIHGFAPYLRELVSLKLISNNNGFCLQPPRARTKKTLGDRAFLTAAPKIWNELPYDVRNEGSYSKFKSLLKTHYFRLAFY